MTSNGPIKNNLEDVLRRRKSQTSTPTTTSASTISTSKRSKFTPSISTSASSNSVGARKPFSTPGFGTGVKKVPSSAARKNEIVLSATSGPSYSETIDISDDDDDSPPRTRKRPSDTSDLRAELSASVKRTRVEISEDKENCSVTVSSVQANVSVKRDKGKGKAPPKSPTISPVKRKRDGKEKAKVEVDNDEPWMTMDFGNRSMNPFERLDEDFPNRDPPEKKHEDLRNASKQQLNYFFTWNSNFLTDYETRITNYRLQPDNKVDIVTLEGVQTFLKERIAAIRDLLGNDESAAGPSHVAESVASPYFSRSGGPSVSTESLAVPSSDHIQPALEHEVIDIDDIEDHDAPASDDRYWDDLDEIDMEGYDESAELDNPPEQFLTLPVEPPNSHSKFKDNPHYPEVMRVLKETFHLESFRKNQIEAILATLEGRDVLVLMPTGGGKSLCYQLPAVCKGGRTSGITIVISPLKSLMSNQLASLKEKNIDVIAWNSESTDGVDIAKRLRGNNKPSLLYVSPEKLKDSNQLNSILHSLHQKKEIARFVVDEAHCISTWGQDFREAYSTLGNLRREFPNVPMIALTATATTATLADIKKQLKLNANLEHLTQSFNRPNLNYIIHDKPRKVVDSIAEYIINKHPNHTGIIYCLGRDRCQKVAETLCSKGLSAKHYHAGMDAESKERVLTEWQTNRCRIIVATIAFGMGIDKPDVRFVIHHELPKSLDGYYQETGRAGRDGKPADCILYYSYRDFKTIVQMIQKNDTHQPPESLRRQENAARAVVGYCMDKSDCRRVQLLQFFDEKFDQRACQRRCDNCTYDGPIEEHDLTEHAKNIVKLIQSCQGERVTIDQSRAIYKGANTDAIRKKGHERLAQYAGGKDLPNDLLEQLFRRLCLIKVVDESPVEAANGFHNYYLVLGDKHRLLLQGKIQVKVRYRRSVQKSSTKAGTSKAPRKANAPKKKF